MESTHQKLCRMLFNELSNLSHEQIRLLAHTRGTRLNTISRCFAIYHAASNSKAAKRAGIIGVGLVAYAEARLNTFITRAQIHIEQ